MPANRFHWKKKKNLHTFVRAQKLSRDDDRDSSDDEKEIAQKSRKRAKDDEKKSPAVSSPKNERPAPSFESIVAAAIVVQKLWRAKRARRFMSKARGGHRDAMVFASSKRIFTHSNDWRKLMGSTRFFFANKGCHFMLAWSALVLFSILEYGLEFLSPWWFVVTLRAAFTDSLGAVVPEQLALLYFCYALLYLIMRVIRKSFEEDLQARLHLSLQKDVIRLCAQFNRLISQEEVTRILQRTKNVPDSLVRYAPSAVFNSVLFIASQALLFQQSGVLGFISLGFMVALVILAFFQARFRHRQMLQQKAKSLMEDHLWAFLNSNHSAETGQTITDMFQADHLPRRKYKQCISLVNNAQLALLLSTPLAVLFMGGFVEFQPYRLLSAALYFALSRLQFFFLTQALIHLYDNTTDVLSLSAFLDANRVALRAPEVIPDVRGREEFAYQLQTQSAHLAERYWTPKQNVRFSNRVCGTRRKRKKETKKKERERERQREREQRGGENTERGRGEKRKEI